MFKHPDNTLTHRLANFWILEEQHALLDSVVIHDISAVSPAGAMERSVKGHNKPKHNWLQLFQFAAESAKIKLHS